MVISIYSTYTQLYRDGVWGITNSEIYTIALSKVVWGM